MQEKADPIVMTAFAQHAGERHQVVVVNPNQIIRLE